MNAQTWYREAMRDVVGPAVRQAGFKGSTPTWRRSNDLGDWILVNVQKSPWCSADQVECVVNLAAAPAPWLDWQHAAWGRSRRGAFIESDGLYRSQLYPPETERSRAAWWVITTSAEAAQAAAEMVTALTHQGLPTLTTFLDRAATLKAVRAGDLGEMTREAYPVYFAEAEAVLLADNGFSQHLEDLLDYAATHASAGLEMRARLAAWVRDRAARAHGRSGSAAAPVKG